MIKKNNNDRIMIMIIWIMIICYNNDGWDGHEGVIKYGSCG
jgi:hypothetical protein